MQDFNGGLILRVIESIPRRQIIQLREVFSKISIAQLAQRIELLGQEKDQDCQHIVVDMVGVELRLPGWSLMYRSRLELSERK